MAALRPNPFRRRQGFTPALNMGEKSPPPGDDLACNRAEVTKKSHIPMQGQHPAFVYYTKAHRIAPAEIANAESLQGIAAIRAPNGGQVGGEWVDRTHSRAGRSIRLPIPPEELPGLE
jgi:hypothetical protein